MKELTDEMLVAYADGELAPAEREAVERRLAADPTARERLAVFTTTGRWLARAYDDTLREPLPAGLVAAIRAEGIGSRSASRRGLLDQLGSSLRAVATPVVGAAGLAAGVALTLALQPTAPAGPDRDVLLAAVLDQAVSGEARFAEAAGARLEVMPIGTLRTASGGLCREYAETRSRGDQAPEVAHGVACRTGDESWRVVASIDVTPDGPEGRGFTLASGDEQALFEALLAAIGTEEVLSPEEERRLIDDEWR